MAKVGDILTRRRRICYLEARIDSRDIIPYVRDVVEGLFCKMRNKRAITSFLFDRHVFGWKELFKPNLPL